MQITATRLGAHALSAGGMEDIAITTQMLVDREVLLSDAKLLASWQPNLELRIAGREFWFNHGRDIFICPRFQLSLNRGVLWQRYQPQQYHAEEDVFLPNVRLINLNALRGRLTGTWRLDAAVAAFRRQEIEDKSQSIMDANPGINPGAAAERFMDSLSYVLVGTYSWRVVEERQLITASGEFAHAREPDELQQVEVSVADL